MAFLAACVSSSPPSACELRAVGVCIAVEDCVGWRDADYKSCFNHELDGCPAGTSQDSAERCAYDIDFQFCDEVVDGIFGATCDVQVIL